MYQMKGKREVGRKRGEEGIPGLPLIKFRQTKYAQGPYKK
jgi:hypothetical protein